jgi:hypothetical protein
MNTYRSSDWSEVEIDWTAGLPVNRLFEDHELPTNKDKRYAMSVSPDLLLDSSGEFIPLRAQATTESPNSL